MSSGVGGRCRGAGGDIKSSVRFGLRRALSELKITGDQGREAFSLVSLRAVKLILHLWYDFKKAFYNLAS